MNLELWNKVKNVPDSAKKKIGGGRLSGMTDINPVWRLRTLTEQFGPVGIGWYYEVTDKRLEHGENSEIAAFVDINLYINDPTTGWSKPISGTGGSMFVTKEKNGLYTSDECFKMALTDALSVACKALGIGADVYWEKADNKYDAKTPNETALKPTTQAVAKSATTDLLTKEQIAEFQKLCILPEDKDRLKQARENLGYSKLSEVKASDYTRLMDQFNEIGRAHV